jgi:Mn2+/Fe2+ NRAMP family transporter
VSPLGGFGLLLISIFLAGLVFLVIVAPLQLFAMRKSLDMMAELLMAKNDPNLVEAIRRNQGSPILTSIVLAIAVAALAVFFVVMSVPGKF